MSSGNTLSNTHRSSVRSSQSSNRHYNVSKMVKPYHRNVTNNQSRGSTSQGSYRRIENSYNEVQSQEWESAFLINHPSQQPGFQGNNSSQYYMLDVEETTQIGVTLHDDISMPPTVYMHVLRNDFCSLF